MYSKLQTSFLFTGSETGIASNRVQQKCERAIAGAHYRLLSLNKCRTTCTTLQNPHQNSEIWHDWFTTCAHLFCQVNCNVLNWSSFHTVLA